MQPEPELDATGLYNGGLTLMELRSDTCRWPVGDPTKPDFRFCGAVAPIDKPYCVCHTHKASDGRGRVLSREHREALSRAALQYAERRKSEQWVRGI